MLAKKILIFLPVMVLIILLQSYFWVPNYKHQAKGNPKRLKQYITASSGDVAIINPILNADSASSDICDKIFDGLIDRDENLKLRGRLAKSWEIYEEAYFYFNDDFSANPRFKTPEAVKETLEQAIFSDNFTSSNNLTPSNNSTTSDTSTTTIFLKNIKQIEVTPQSMEERVVTEQVAKPDGQIQEIQVKININRPPGIKMTLYKVDQDLFNKLGAILPDGYFNQERLATLLTIADPNFSDRRDNYLKEYLAVTEHNPVIIFHLRPGVKFADGHAFDADDVRFTYEAIMEPANRSPRRSDFEPIKSLEVIDPYQIKVIYNRLFQPALSAWGIGMLPEHLLNKEALSLEAKEKGQDPAVFNLRQSDFNKTRPIGTGPFKFLEWQSDEYIRLVRHEDYWEGPPHYHEFIYRIIPDVLTQELEFFAGAVDSYGAQAHQVNRLKQDPRFQNFSGLSYSYTYIAYNLNRELFKDKRVRKALTMAINIQEIIDYVLYGEGEPTTGPFLKQSDHYNQQVKPLPYNPEAALALLREAGWEKDKQGLLRNKEGKHLEFTIITNNGNPYREAILIIAQNAWKRLGIKVSADRIEWSVFLSKHVDVKNFDALILSWGMGLDPDLYQIWHSSQTGDYQLNFVSYKNKEADDLIIKIRQEYDEEKQIALCQRLHEIIYDDQPYTFLYVSKWTALLDKKIAILDQDERGLPLIKKITPTKTGNYSFYFNKWIKFPTVPSFSPGNETGLFLPEMIKNK